MNTKSLDQTLTNKRRRNGEKLKEENLQKSSAALTMLAMQKVFYQSIIKQKRDTV